MEPYTKEAIARAEAMDKLHTSSDAAEALAQQSESKKPKEYYEYDLVGIVVHQGTAQCGHYYSFIKERVPLEEGQKPGRWLEFNDTKVTLFDPDRIPYECYGGKEKVKVYDREKGCSVFAKRYKSNNAYLLVYQRVMADVDELRPKKVVSKVDAKNEPDAATSPDVKGKEPAEVAVDDVGREGEEEEEEEEEDLGAQPSERKVDDEDSSFDSLTPNVSASSLVALAQNEKESGANDNQAAVTAAPPTEKNHLDGGVLKDSPGFLALLFIARLKRQQRAKMLAEKKRQRDEQRRKYLAGETNSIVPEDIVNSIWGENREFLLQKYIHGTDFFRFIWDICNLYSNTTTTVQQQKESKASRKGKKSRKKPKKSIQTDDKVAKSLSMLSTKFATEFMLDIGSRSKEDPLYDIWMYHLQRLYTNDIDACHWLLRMLCEIDAKNNHLVNILLRCPFAKVRQSFVDLLVHVMKQVVEGEREYYIIEARRAKEVRKKERQKQKGSKKTSKKKSTEKEANTGKENTAEQQKSPAQQNGPQSYVIALIERLFEMLPTVQIYMRHAKEFFYIFRDFASLGKQELQYLILRRTPKEFVQFYMQTGRFESSGEDEPRYGRGGVLSRTRATNGTRYKRPMGMGILHAGRLHAPNLTGLCQFLALCICSCSTNSSTTPPSTIGYTTPAKAERQPQTKESAAKDKPQGVAKDPNADLTLLTMHKNDRDLVIGKEFLARLVKDQINLLPVAQIMQHWAWEDKRNSKVFITVLTDGISGAKMESVRPYFQVLLKLLVLEDSVELQEWRVSFSLGTIFKIITNKMTSKECVKQCIKFIKTMSETSPPVRKWLRQRKSAWNVILDMETVEPSNNTSGGSGLRRGIFGRFYPG
eukprot:TRINITY_DN2082_c1_g1_i1.p1 TRINITY_DN2082_c1_g1~~TRINITY_DN2082_c1_g1_i1.p1  ORF type:complete len:946 (-),score=239.67 TRINITY_DN2082_c1_g1_i1:53-2668(-)